MRPVISTPVISTPVISTPVTAAALPLLLIGLMACDRDRMYSENTFSDNVFLAYQECSKQEIKFLTTKHNIQTAFEPCGSNNFVDYAWSPDGLNLYFQLPMSAHLMDGETKEVVTLPSEVPVSGVAWLSPELLVLPLSPAAGSTKPRLALFDRVQANLNTLELEGVSGVQHLHAMGTLNQVMFTALKGGARQILVADFNTGEMSQPFAFATGTVETMSYSPELNLLGVGSGGHVRVYQAQDGVQLYDFDDASRVVFHPEGRYFALETMGDPISPFDQRTWNELSPEAREREERRMKEWLEKQPDWVDETVTPPVLDVFDLQTRERYRLGFVYGDRFQWYPTQNYYASFVLWGLEGKELNRNVALTQLHERLRMAAKGTMAQGVELRPFTPLPGAPLLPAPGASPTTPAPDAAPSADGE